MKNISKIILLLTLFLSSMSIKGQFSIYNKGADSNIEKINREYLIYDAYYPMNSIDTKYSTGKLMKK